MVAIWPFKMPNHPNLAFLKRFAGKKMIWRFWILKKIVYFKACCGEM